MCRIGLRACGFGVGIFGEGYVDRVYSQEQPSANRTIGYLASSRFARLLQPSIGFASGPTQQPRPDNRHAWALITT